MRARVAALVFAGVFLFALVSLAMRLDVLPGLHGDEAWVGLAGPAAAPPKDRFTRLRLSRAHPVMALGWPK